MYLKLNNLSIFCTISLNYIKEGLTKMLGVEYPVYI